MEPNSNPTIAQLLDTIRRLQEDVGALDTRVKRLERESEEGRRGTMGLR